MEPAPQAPEQEAGECAGFIAAPVQEYPGL
jgi:hypothetical protein